MSESRPIAWPAYLVSGAMIVIPLVDSFTSLYPWNFGEARWRFGAVGLVSNALLIPMVGILVAFVTASVLDHWRVRRAIGIVGFAAATLCLIALVSFALDALQTRAAVRPEMRLSFNVASITAAVKTLLAGTTFGAFGVAGWKGSTPGTAPRDIPLFAGRVSGPSQAKPR